MGEGNHKGKKMSLILTKNKTINEESNRDRPTIEDFLEILNSQIEDDIQKRFQSKLSTDNDNIIKNTINIKRYLELDNIASAVIKEFKYLN